MRFSLAVKVNDPPLQLPLENALRFLRSIFPFSDRSASLLTRRFVHHTLFSLGTCLPPPRVLRERRFPRGGGRFPYNTTSTMLLRRSCLVDPRRGGLLVTHPFHLLSPPPPPIPPFPPPPPPPPPPLLPPLLPPTPHPPPPPPPSHVTGFFFVRLRILSAFFLWRNPRAGLFFTAWVSAFNPFFYDQGNPIFLTANTTFLPLTRLDSLSGCNSCSLDSLTSKS